MELTPAQKFDATIRAAAAGDVCVCCFRLMVRRQLRQPGRPSPFGRVPDGHASVAVPVCLGCTLTWGPGGLALGLSEPQEKTRKPNANKGVGIAKSRGNPAAKGRISATKSKGPRGGAGPWTG